VAEKVQVDLATTGADKAAGDVDKVAASVERLEAHDEVTVTADADVDAATRGMDDVTSAVEDVDGRDATVTATADTEAATRGLDDVTTAVADVDGREATVTATVDNQTAGPLSDIQSDLESLKARAKETGDQLDHVTSEGGGGGGHLRGQAIADLTGPLGDVSGQASDLAGVFDGLSDTLGGFGARFGVSADAIETGLGGISFAAAGVVALWGLWRQRQEEAAAQLQKVADQQRKLNDLLQAGSFDQAAQQLVDNYGAVYDAADRAGIPVQELTNYLAGYSDELPTVTKHIQDIAAAQHDHGDTTATVTAKYVEQVQAIYDTRAQIDKANDSIKTQDDRSRGAADALSRHTDAADDATDAEKRLKSAADDTNATFDRMRDAVNLTSEFDRLNANVDEMAAKIKSGTAASAQDLDGLRGDIIQLARDAHANPIDVQSTLEKIDRGDLAGVKSDAERWFQGSPVRAKGVLDLTQVIFPNVGRAPGAQVTGYSGSIFGQSAPAPTTVINLTQHVPRGYRGDVLAAGERAAKRTGGMYMRSHR
jgi:hypothetical protein